MQSFSFNSQTHNLQGDGLSAEITPLVQKADAYLPDVPGEHEVHYQLPADENIGDDEQLDTTINRMLDGEEIFQVCDATGEVPFGTQLNTPKKYIKSLIE